MPHLHNAIANRLADIALGHVEHEFPNHIAHRLHTPDDAARPSVLHSIFYGSFDWHCCVHWLLARLAATAKSAKPLQAIESLFARRITAQR